MRSLWIAPILVSIAVTACETREAPRGDSSSRAQPVHVERKEELPTTAECGTLRDVVPGDLVTVANDLLFHVDETEGFAITNVADPSRPRTLARVPFVGMPLAIHLRGTVAWIAYVDWDPPGAATVIHAIDVTHPEAPRVVGGIRRPGVATGTALVDGAFYVMDAKGDASSVAGYRVTQDGLAFADEVALDGKPGALAASPMGLATITTASEGTVVSWIDLARDRPGVMMVRGTRRVPGGFPAWERDIVSADEGQAVRFLACAAPACGTSEDAVVRVVDFANGAADVRATLPIRVGAGVPVARFYDDHLFVADEGVVRLVSLHPTPRVVGNIRVEGIVSALRPYETHLVAVGTVGTPSNGIRVAVHDIDVRVPWLPRLRGTATFGEDWTWSRASDDDRAISIDPTTSLVALPFSTWRARDGRYATGAQVLALGRGKPQLREALPADGHVERVVFVKDRVLAVGGGNVTVLEEAPERELEVR